VPDLSNSLVEQVRSARESGTALQIRGQASKPWMSAASGAEALSLAGHSGIVSYDPTELVVTVRAGTPLAELEQALAEQGQMLAMEAPDFNGGSSIGGVVALGWSGSRSLTAGGVRDAVLGLRMINGLGEELRFGGQVMKNVAGFDISRLMVGSCGRLGAILEVSLKVLPRPEREVSLQWSLPNLAASRDMVADWERRAYPVSAACFSEGMLKARFSAAGALLDEIYRDVGGEPCDGKFWGDLQRLALPLFHHGWGDEKLFDCNGDICWSAHSRSRGGGPLVSLSDGPAQAQGEDALGQLQTRIRQSFDPGGLFQPEPAA
jgi:glycolate oxidase FAD binding subunit